MQGLVPLLRPLSLLRIDHQLRRHRIRSPMYQLRQALLFALNIACWIHQIISEQSAIVIFDEPRERILVP